MKLKDQQLEETQEKEKQRMITIVIRTTAQIEDTKLELEGADNVVIVVNINEVEKLDQDIPEAIQMGEKK